MSNQRAGTETLITRDIQTGGGRTANRLAHELKATGQVDPNFKTGFIQVDVPWRGGSTRVHLQKTETGSVLSLWEVDQSGNPNSASCELMTYEAPSGRRTVVSGSSAQSLDGGDRRVSPRELASKIDSTVKNLRRNGLRVVIDSNSG